MFIIVNDGTTGMATLTIKILLLRAVASKFTPSKTRLTLSFCAGWKSLQAEGTAVCNTARSCVNLRVIIARRMCADAHYGHRAERWYQFAIS